MMQTRSKTRMGEKEETCVESSVPLGQPRMESDVTPEISRLCRVLPQEDYRTQSPSQYSTTIFTQ